MLLQWKNNYHEIQNWKISYDHNIVYATEKGTDEKLYEQLEKKAVNRPFAYMRSFKCRNW